jgi:hypothetical protein
MTSLSHIKSRVLAIYPYRKGFGFAVFSGVDLVDWGLARVYSTHEEEVLIRVQVLIERHQACALATEDGTNSRRGDRSRRLVERMIGYGRLRGLQVMTVSRDVAREVFGLDGRATNHDLSVRLASYFIELQQILPTKRRFYDSEDARTNVFRAVSIAAAAQCRSGESG